MSDTLKKLEDFTPLHSFHMGHTPFQIEHFKTSSQRGSREFEYWQHVIQLKALWRSLKSLELDLEDASAVVGECAGWFPFWNRAARRRKLRRAEFKLSELQQSFKEKSLEADRHLAVLENNYGDLKGMTEEELLAFEESYWIARLSRQIAFSALAARSAVSVGDLSAIAALPEAVQAKVYRAVEQVLSSHSQNGIEGKHGNPTARLQQPADSGKSSGDL